MTTKTIYQLLDETGFPYYRQGTVPAGNTDSAYFTFWNIDSRGQAYLDNDNRALVRRYGVAFYTRDAVQLEGGPLDDLIQNAKASDWIIEQFPYDTPSNIPEVFGRYTRIVSVVYYL